MLFPSLDETRIRKTKSIFNPQRIVGDLPKHVWETCMTRMLMNQRIATNSPTANQAIASVYRQRFITEVRSLLEYDEDLYEAPNIALRNMASWNDAHRIVLALRNSAEQFALQRLVKMIDELGEILVPQIFIDTYLATAPPGSWGTSPTLSADQKRNQETAPRRSLPLHAYGRGIRRRFSGSNRHDT